MKVIGTGGSWRAGRCAFHELDNDREPLVRKVDCIRLHVADLDKGLAFYRDRLGHALIWRKEEAAGLRPAADETEIVLQTERVPDTDKMPLEVDLEVDSADAAVVRFQEAGGEVVVPPFEIQIGRAAVVQDPWGNRFVLLDASKGHLIADGRGRVMGVGELPSLGGYDVQYEEALRLAARAHRSQTRKGTDLPYIAHPVHVSMILQHYGFSREAVLAGLLHDVVEDQDVTLAEIESRFGALVTEIVDALSERRFDEHGEVRPWRVRKSEAVEQIRKASPTAVAVKGADVLHNVQSILYDLRIDGAAVWGRFTRGPEQMLGYYGRIAELVQAKLGSHPLVKELSTALAVLIESADRLGCDDAQAPSER